ncbi:MAG TPA: cation:proton antiporter [Streptosporangiaceae bacterium]|nr:cation:proton antiporter [Streptosporangiaceae bacterium]
MSLNDVQLLLADVAFIIILARLLGTAAKLLGQPPVLGEILAGILLGPTFFHGAITKALFPASLIPPLTALADIGLVLFMFVVGYEVDLRLIRGRERVAAGVSLGSVILPLGLGTALGVWLAHRNHLHNVSSFALFIGTAMAATAFPVLARILTDRGLHRTRIGGIALASAAIADVLAWILLAVVVAVAGSSAQWKVLLAFPYAAAMFGIVRPLLRRLSRFYLQAGRLTPNILATVLAGLLLSAAATNWMGLHFIFGAFLFGVIMPRENVLGLREEILERLLQISVLVLLPIYFVVSGLSINLSTIGSSGLEELGAILVVAIVGKFVGAYLGAQLTGVRGRNAGVIATLMNTRGLTELVILGVGLQLHILTPPLYTLMVVMALVTTAMSGPLLKAIYPDRVMQRDLAAADRAQLAGGPAYRILVLIDQLDTAGPLVDIGADLAATRPGSELALVYLVSFRTDKRLELGAGLGGELLQMTTVMGQLHELAERAAARGAPATVFSRFSDDAAGELSAYVMAAEPDTIVLDTGHAAYEDQAYAAIRAEGRTRLVTASGPVPDAPNAVAVYSGHGADAAAALNVATQLAAARHLPLVLAGADGRRGRSDVADLTHRGIQASSGPPPEGALLVVGEDGAAAVATGAQLTVRAGSSEDLEARPEIATPVSALEPGRQP